MNKRTISLMKLIGSMLIFGSIGLFVRYIPLESSQIAFIRAFVGVLFLSIAMSLKRKRISASAVKKNLLYLILSGTAIGFNWILLFESYKYTSVAVSTLCYYMAPIIIIALSPIVLKEKLTGKHLLCIAAALFGIFMISGVFSVGSIKGSEGKGILLGLGAAALYATAILCNKQLCNIGAMDRTVCQLLITAMVLLPYNLFATDLNFTAVTPGSLVLLVAVGVIHTGLAYYLYFGSLDHLSGQSIAIASYIDPVVAVLLSAFILREPFTAETMVGAAAILMAALVSEIPLKRGKKA